MKRVLTAGVFGVLSACGGSSSETPFPQAPLDPKLERRHEAAFSQEQEGEEAGGDLRATGAPAAAASGTTSAEPSVAPTPAPPAAPNEPRF